MEYKSFDNLPVVKPVTAGRDYHDSHMQETKRTAAQSKTLDRILSHYQKGVEEEVAAEASMNTNPINSDEVVNI